MSMSFQEFRRKIIEHGKQRKELIEKIRNDHNERVKVFEEVARKRDEDTKRDFVDSMLDYVMSETLVDDIEGNENLGYCYGVVIHGNKFSLTDDDVRSVNFCSLQRDQALIFMRKLFEERIKVSMLNNVIEKFELTHDDDEVEYLEREDGELLRHKLIVTFKQN